VDFLTHFTADLDEELLGDRLVTHPHRRIIRELLGQAAGDFSGDHHCSSQDLNWGASGLATSFAVFGQRTRSQVL
jgi:hypothetical protein